ncbi:regulatory LuxR family protein [Sphingomonas sp. PP-CE-3G-477]|uniref:helix-turn-helix domain-containing protein n=1 Tax=unclassified Sphingomonas TaxID=196159 RepID=UPI000D4FC29E|nr:MULTISPECIES: LuxR C-terminal-related transcriptional regulator [unclassified Sphingomonas]PTQ63795.1 regulatory LuxR family protein [Sphingomonas sp. PP-CE-3G-477]
MEGPGHETRQPTAAATVTETRAALTPTQLRVLRGVHSGLLNKQIAFDLGIAEATVKVHMTALMRKLNVRNRTQAAILAQSLAI